MSTDEKPKNQIAVSERNISDAVLSKINAFQQAGQLRLPPDYSAENALKAAYLILQDTKNANKQPVLEVCSRESIANALLKMVVWGLSPLKKQCDFIAYGNSLECQPEYTGNIVLAKRYGKLKDIRANAIFEKDVFEFTVDAMTGRKKITKHEQSIDSMNSKIVKGAYAVMEFTDGSFDVEIMTFEQILQAWKQGPMKGNSPAHNNFPDQMSCKTVINRACKLLIRASDDSILFENNTDEKKDIHYEDAQFEVVSNSNKTPLDITPQLEKESAQVIDIKEEGLQNNTNFENESNVNPN